jgi:hypothetical protein
MMSWRSLLNVLLILLVVVGLGLVSQAEWFPPS